MPRTTDTDVEFLGEALRAAGGKRAVAAVPAFNAIVAERIRLIEENDRLRGELREAIKALRTIEGVARATANMSGDEADVVGDGESE